MHKLNAENPTKGIERMGELRDSPATSPWNPTKGIESVGVDYEALKEDVEPNKGN